MDADGERQIEKQMVWHRERRGQIGERPLLLVICSTTLICKHLARTVEVEIDGLHQIIKFYVYGVYTILVGN